MPVDDITVRQDWKTALAGLRAKRREVVLVAALVAGVALLGTFLSLRRPAAQIAPPAGSEVAAALPEAPGALPSPSGTLLVHVAGAVRHPGLYELPLGARVADAVEAAGGPTRRGDLDALNLAQPIADGTKVEVTVRSGGTRLPLPEATPTPRMEQISLNSADQAALETIPGVGPVTAGSILTFREQNGGFTSLSQLLEVDGIGPATLDSILPYVTL